MTFDLEKQEGQKTVVSFAAGLLIGGLLVWIFSGSPEAQAPADETPAGDESNMPADETTTEDDSTATDETVTADNMTVGEGSVSLGDTVAGNVLTITGAVFPTEEGWVGVRTYADGEPGSILGVSRYSKEQGLTPAEIDLLVPTVAGNQYVVVFFAEDGDMQFNPAMDAQLDTEMTVFTAK